MDTAPDSPRLRILIVDHNALMPTVLAEALADEGIDCQLAASFDAARQQVSKGPAPDFVLVDLELPDLPGDTVCRELMSLSSLAGACFLLYGEEGDAEVAARVRNAGVSSYLQTPFSPVRILEWLDQNRQDLAEPDALPRVPAHDLPPRSFSVEDLEDIPPPSLGPLPRRVLVVDDDPDVLQLATLVFEMDGLEVETATDWQSFREHLVFERFGVIVLDIGLPYVTGDKLALFAKAFLEPPQPRILLYSALPETKLGELAQQVGADGHLTKGHPPEELVAVVGRLLSLEGESRGELTEP